MEKVKLTELTVPDCSCHECKAACEYRPGWFKPGEAEKAAELMGLSLQEFFDQYLSVDWYIGDGDNIFLLAPTIVHGEFNYAGEEYPADPRGKCIFFENGLCRIHAAKPYECRMMYHDQSGQEVRTRHDEVAQAWDSPEHQAQIVELLGDEPVAIETTLFYFLW